MGNNAGVIGAVYLFKRLKLLQDTIRPASHESYEAIMLPYAKDVQDSRAWGPPSCCHI